MLERLVDAAREVGDLLLDGARLVGLALLEVGIDLLAVLGHDLAQTRGRLLAALVAGSDDHLAGRGERDRVSSATPLLSSARSASVAWAAAAISSVRAARCASRSALVRASSSLSSSFWRLTLVRNSSSSSARRSPALPPRPSASSSIAARARLRASSSTCVTMYSAKYRIRSRLRGLMSSRMPSRLGVPLKYQMWLTGLASWMWPIRSRRTLLRVTSTPHLSQMMPL